MVPSNHSNDSFCRVKAHKKMLGEVSSPLCQMLSLCYKFLSHLVIGTRKGADREFFKTLTCSHFAITKFDFLTPFLLSFPDKCGLYKEDTLH